MTSSVSSSPKLSAQDLQAKRDRLENTPLVLVLSIVIHALLGWGLSQMRFYVRATPSAASVDPLAIEFVTIEGLEQSRRDIPPNKEDSSEASSNVENTEADNFASAPPQSEASEQFVPNFEPYEEDAFYSDSSEPDFSNSPDDISTLPPASSEEEASQDVLSSEQADNRIAQQSGVTDTPTFPKRPKRFPEAPLPGEAAPQPEPAQDIAARPPALPELPSNPEPRAVQPAPSIDSVDSSDPTFNGEGPELAEGSSNDLSEDVAFNEGDAGSDTISEPLNQDSSEAVFNQPVRDINPYLANIKWQIESRWIPSYTDTSREVTIYFSVDRVGNVISAYVSSPSGSATVDSEALQSVQSASGSFGALPFWYERNTLDIAFTFSVNVSGGYIY